MTSKTTLEAAPTGGRNLCLNQELKAIRTFHKRWREALYEGTRSRKEMSKFDDFWERTSALAQLPPAVQMLGYWTRQYLHTELAIYSRYLNRIVQTNAALRSICKTISDARTAVVGLSTGTELEHSIQPYSQRLFRLQQEIEQLVREYWDVVFTQGKLKFEGKEYPRLDEDPDWRTKRKLNPFLEVRNTDLGLNLFRKDYPPYSDRLTEDRGIRFISDDLHLPVLKQERNLDTIFQVRTGDLLRSETEHSPTFISLTTISRLVLLVYICADLATDIGGKLIITGSDPKRELRVEKTYETLRDAGLR